MQSSCQIIVDYLNNLGYNHVTQNHGNIKHGLSACLKILKSHQKLREKGTV